ncbi:MAG: rhodanese-like domain-containing protein [Pirellulaceae bacterium]
MNSEVPLPADIDVLSVKKMLDEGERFVLLDVREPEEFTTASIDGTLQIPMRTVPSRLADLEPHRGERIVVHCHHGGRSARVAQWLRDQGFEKVQNMAGGIDAWSQFVDTSVPRY